MSTQDSIGYTISNTARRLTLLLTQRFQPFDITPEQWSTLYKLLERDGITQRELAERTGKDPANVTRILDQLERKGWIKRKANKEDRRSFLAFVTDEGRTQCEKLIPIEADFVRSTISTLTDDETTALRTALGKINEQLDRMSP